MNLKEKFSKSVSADREMQDTKAQDRLREDGQSAQCDGLLWPLSLKRLSYGDSRKSESPRTEPTCCHEKLSLH